jgi:hypothetical protein
VNIDLDPVTARKLAAVIRFYERHLLDRYGWLLPPDLAGLAVRLRDGERDALARKRALSAARSRRYRAAKRRAAPAMEAAGGHRGAA